MTPFLAATTAMLFWVTAQDPAPPKPRPGSNKQEAVKTPTPTQNSPAQPKTGSSPKSDDLWTMNLKAMKTPTDSLMGRIGGQSFQPDKIKLSNGILKFRTGNDFLADCEVIIFLFEKPQELVGKTLEINPEQKFGALAPHIHIHNRRAKKSGSGSAGGDVYVSNYAMKLEFQQGEGGTIRGKIHLCLPDKDKSYLAGTFVISDSDKAMPPTKAGTVTGQIKIQLPTNRFFASVAAYGVDTNGHPIVSSSVGFDVKAGENSDASSSNISLVLKNNELSYNFQPTASGTYLIIFSFNRIPVAWEWFTHEAGQSTTKPLTGVPGKYGSLEVRLSAPNVKEVRLLPLGPKGSLPDVVGNGRKVVSSLSPSLKGLMAPVPSGKTPVQFPQLAAGHYRVFAGDFQADVQIIPGKTNQVVLK